ncbi:protein late bloomer [Drosophila innubila]|uniref:protein late bloomer n=1 Tax=Drosophila innubila TaxID=198719 RepID=UPI00148E5772|nr:protein late bloomer [Drosophila innubila]
MGCPTNVVKIISISLNAILAFLACGAIAWIAINSDTEQEEFVIASYVFSGLIVLMVIVGIYAAIRESICLTATVAVFLLLLVILQIVNIFMFVNPMKLQSGQETVEIAWQANNMDGLQQQFKCCGKTSAQDYVHLNQVIPPSCYTDLQQVPDHLFLNGCIEKVQDQYESDKRRFLIVSWGLAAFLLLCFVGAVFLGISFRNKQRRLQF